MLLELQIHISMYRTPSIWGSPSASSRSRSTFRFHWGALFGVYLGELLLQPLHILDIVKEAHMNIRGKSEVGEYLLNPLFKVFFAASSSMNIFPLYLLLNKYVAPPIVRYAPFPPPAVSWAYQIRTLENHTHSVTKCSTS